MHIESVRIQNYRSIADSGLLSFSPGFNLVVGANNVGKSSLLLCLAGRFQGDSHKSIHTLPHRDEPLDRTSQVEFTFVVSGEELRRLLLNSGTDHRRFPWPVDTPFEDMQQEAVLAQLLNAEAVPVHIVGKAEGQNLSWDRGEYPSTRLCKARFDGAKRRMLHVRVDAAARTITPKGVGTLDRNEEDFGFDVATSVAHCIYWFSPERPKLGTAPFGRNTELAPAAENLAEVLMVLQGNPERFAAYCNLAKDVFPSIQKVAVRPSVNNFVEIMIWQVDPTLQRDDLAMPLSQCGTGVGQVLAMLYVVKTSDQPRTIVIDEPASFLHPGASRALIGILKRFPQHQYIIATHSPEILAELSDAPVTIVRWGDSRSEIQQYAHTTGDVALEALTEVGARLSDVYGFDKILWVEGQSDALSLKALLDEMGKPQRGLGILPVRDTGSFRRRKIAEILDIYRTLSTGGALLPPAVLFLFDRDARSETEIEDAKRESNGRVRFLERRMFENYLLNPDAIAEAYNEAGEEHGINTTSPKDVREWIADNGSRFCEAGHAVFTKDWLENVDGASLLEELFNEMSENKLPFRKTVHTPRLTVLLHKHDETAAQKILDLVADVIA